MGTIGNSGNEGNSEPAPIKKTIKKRISRLSHKILFLKECAAKNINNDPLIFPSGVSAMNKSSDSAMQNPIPSPFIPVQNKISYLQKEIDGIKTGLSEQCKAVKEEFDDHLSAINSNTEELENVYNVFSEMDEKIEKLNSRIDNVHMMFSQLLWQTNVSIELSNEEQKIFFLLCSYKNYLKMGFVCSKIKMPENNIKESITSLIDKGIPVLQKNIGGQAFLKLDDKFRQLQKKNKIIKINPAIAKQFENRTLESFFPSEVSKVVENEFVNK